MKIKDVIKELESIGYNVSFYKRKDGGIRITRINGETFRGSSGNQKARNIVGTTLSEAQVRALGKLKTPKGKGSYNKRRKAPLDEETKKRIQKLQRVYRKSGKAEGKPTIRNYRYIVKEKGKAEADRLLRQAERRILGLAYTENVDWILIKLKQIQNRFPSKKLEQAIKEIENKRENFREKWIHEIYDLGTTSELGADIQAGYMTSEELGEKILAIIG